MIPRKSMNPTKGSSSKRKLKKDDAAARPSTRPKLGVGASSATADAVDNVPSAENLDATDALVTNNTPFICSRCIQMIGIGRGVVLRECGHKFDKRCLKRYIKSSTTEEVSCPYSESGMCTAKLQQEEIQRLVSKKNGQDFIEKTAEPANELAEETIQRPAEPEVNVRNLQSKFHGLEVRDASAEEPFDPAVWNMDENPLVPNFETFTCPQCSTEIKPGVGVTLRDCGHNFCTKCLSLVITISEAAEISCPMATLKECEAKLQHREIKQLVSEEQFDLFLQRNAQLAMCCLEDEEVDIPIAMLPNMHAFKCPICMEDIQIQHGVVLCCGHKYCRTCLEGHVKFSDDVEVACPFVENDVKCDVVLRHREIKELVSREDFDAFLRRSELMAESQTEGSFHCKTPNCTGWCVCEDGVKVFKCPVCRRKNCINCAAIHEKVDCKTYQYKKMLKGKGPSSLFLQKY